MRIAAETRAAVADAAWALAVRLGRFGYSEISSGLRISPKRASQMVRGWVEEGAVSLFSSGVGLRTLYQVVDGFKRAPTLDAHGSILLNLWTAMRGLKSFTPTDLAAHSTVDAVKVSVAAAQDYCQILLRADYLKVERTAIPGRRDAIYRLIKVTGPRPPRERRVKALFDENLGRIVHVTGVGK